MAQSRAPDSRDRSTNRVYVQLYPDRQGRLVEVDVPVVVAGAQGAGRSAGMAVLIAATAVAHGYAALTHKLLEFQRVPGLVVPRPGW